MTIDQQSIVELTKSMNSLDTTMTKLFWLIVIVLFLFAGLCWYINREYEKRTGNTADFFMADKASDLFEQGSIDSLLAYCKKFETKYPNDVQVNFYMGLGNYNKGDFSAAKKYFENVLSINPNWKDNVTGYLSEINELASKVDRVNVQ